MNNIPLVSIVTPCYNDGAWIKDTIESIFNSTYNNIEMIIIDDCSSDKATIDILHSISDSRIKIFYNKENRGVCYTRDIAIQYANGKYILPVDADDLITNNYISDAITCLENDPSIRIVATNYRLFGRVNKSVVLDDFSMERLLARNLFTVSSLFYRDDYFKCGGFNQNMVNGLEDWDFWIKLTSLGGSVKYLSEFNFMYRIKSKQLSRNAMASNTMDIRRVLRHQIWENNKAIYAQYYVDPTETSEYIEIVNSRLYKLTSKIFFLIKSIIHVR